MALCSEGSLSCHTYRDTGPRFLRSHPKEPRFSFLNVECLTKEQSLPIFKSWVWKSGSSSPWPRIVCAVATSWWRQFCSVNISMVVVVLETSTKLLTWTKPLDRYVGTFRDHPACLPFTWDDCCPCNNWPRIKKATRKTTTTDCHEYTPNFWFENLYALLRIHVLRHNLTR